MREAAAGRKRAQPRPLNPERRSGATYVTAASRLLAAFSESPSPKPSNAYPRMSKIGARRQAEKLVGEAQQRAGGERLWLVKPVPGGDASTRPSEKGLAAVQAASANRTRSCWAKAAASSTFSW